MAKTYTAYATGIAFASNKSLLGLFNAHATRKVKLYRAWVLNNQTAAVTGVLTSMLLRKISALSAGTAVTPVAHDTGNTSVDLTSVTCVTGGTFTNTADNAFRQIMWSGGDPVVSTLGTFNVLVKLVVPVLAQGISTSGGSGPSASDIASAVWNHTQ